MPAIYKAQTTKQAKASFKARGRPSLSHKEAKQLERSIELEARAERAKEAEKRRADAAKKRLEKEKLDKAQKERNQQLSQRRCDRFGFKASQFHLGAFFGKPRDAGQAKQQSEPEAVIDALDEDTFEDEDLNDEELLMALESPNVSRKSPKGDQHPKSDSDLMPPPPLPSVKPVQRSKTEPAPTLDEDFGNFWDELESSTQIARELSHNSPEVAKAPGCRSTSFNSEDFDLTAEDLDELDPPNVIACPAVKLHHNMLPPALPTKPPNKVMAPPPAPPSAPPPAKRVKSAIRGPFQPASSLYCSPDLGFTFTQLESFVDDDLQLTQAVPG